MLDEAFDATIAAARAGADWAWATLYRDLAGPITGYLVSRGAVDAEDLTSETFLQAARDLHRFSGDERSFRSWLFVIAHRRLIDDRRRAGRRPSEVAWDDRHRAVLAGGDVEQEALEYLVTEEIRVALAGLTEDQRDVMALRIVGGLTLEETAMVVGKRVGAVKALQRRALESLRRGSVGVAVPL